MSHHKIEIQDLCFTYPDGRRAIRDASFSIYHGESVGIIGANGAGKSTLLMLLMGILQADTGEVNIGDMRLTKKTIPLIRRRIGLVFQDPDDQLFMTTVGEDVAFGPRNLGLTEDEVEERVAAALAQVGILHLASRAPSRLSGGEKRAAAIASVLSLRPDILIMDEPTASLDPKSRRRVMTLLDGFQHTKIITSHDLDMVLETCQRVILMNDGFVAADGKTADILGDSELLDNCGLELPLSLQKCPVCQSRQFRVV
ncbi:MAG: ABC transporter ATP-binding protein [Syntrophomonas sp.]|nr:ABC transporter ATP-binding protein [Syntrophomonas sp.]